MDIISKTSYRFLRFPGGKTKAVTFSYDDGAVSDMRLCDIFDKYEMKGTFNLNSSHVLDTTRKTTINLPEMKDILARGHEIALHGYSHKAHSSIAPVEAVRETLADRLYMEKALGKIIRGMAYPDTGIRHSHNGNDYQTVRGILQSVGVAYARALVINNVDFTLPTDWYAWMPTCHHTDPNLFELASKFLDLDVEGKYCSDRYPRLFYVWGHSYEFDNHNNWERIEELCSMLSAKEDIWYATNIEIYNYVKAYESLIPSADSSMIYNPSLMTVWFNVNGKIHSVEPGQTLTIE